MAAPTGRFCDSLKFDRSRWAFFKLNLLSTLALSSR